MKMIREHNENVEVLIEAKSDGKKDYYVQGTFLVSETKNKNGRIYPKHVMDKEVNRYIKEMVNTKRALGQLNHPTDAQVDLQQASHLIESLKEDGNTWYGKAKILSTPVGEIAKGLLDGGVTLGISSRGMGSLKNINGTDIVQEDYHLVTAGDLVWNPSAPGAFLEGIMEDVEWILEGGVWRQQFVEEAKKEIRKASKKDIEAVSLHIFENFMRRI